MTCGIKQIYEHFHILHYCPTYEVESAERLFWRALSIFCLTSQIFPVRPRSPKVDFSKSLEQNCLQAGFPSSCTNTEVGRLVYRYCILIRTVKNTTANNAVPNCNRMAFHQSSAFSVLNETSNSERW